MTVWDAEFIDTAATVADELHVRIPGFDDGEGEFTVAWAPRINDAGTPVLPAANDWAAVTETAEGTWCVLLWAPSEET
jgi:hypothetical protein